MKKSMLRADGYNTGIASEYLILSILYRLGQEAYVSQGNKKSIDIRLIRKDGVAISIDVKSVRGYSSLVVNNVKGIQNHFIVFVIYNNKFDNIELPMPDIYIVPSNVVMSLAKSFKEEKRIMKGDIEFYKNQWEYLTMGFGEDCWDIDEEEEKRIDFIDCFRDLQKYENVSAILKKYGFQLEYFIKKCRENPNNYSIDEERLIHNVYAKKSLETLKRLRNTLLRESTDNPVIETLSIAIKTQENKIG